MRLTDKTLRISAAARGFARPSAIAGARAIDRQFSAPAGLVDGGVTR